MTAVMAPVEVHELEAHPLPIVVVREDSAAEQVWRRAAEISGVVCAALFVVALVVLAVPA